MEITLNIPQLVNLKINRSVWQKVQICKENGSPFENAFVYETKRRNIYAKKKEKYSFWVLCQFYPWSYLWRQEDTREFYIGRECLEGRWEVGEHRNRSSKH